MKIQTVLVMSMVALLVGCAGSPRVIQNEEMVANADPYEIGSIGAYFSGLAGFGIKEGTITAQFTPRTNEVILVFSNQGNDMNLFLTKKVRDFLIPGFVSYLGSFEERTLDRDGKMLAVYGTMPVFMKWGLFNLNAEGTANMTAGYEFYKDQPYYALTFPETINDRNTSSTRFSTVKKSGYFQIYFTKTQLQELGEMLTQEYLEQTLEDRGISRTPSDDPDKY